MKGTKEMKVPDRLEASSAREVNGNGQMMVKAPGFGIGVSIPAPGSPSV